MLSPMPLDSPPLTRSPSPASSLSLSSSLPVTTTVVHLSSHSPDDDPLTRGRTYRRHGARNGFSTNGLGNANGNNSNGVGGSVGEDTSSDSGIMITDEEDDDDTEREISPRRSKDTINKILKQVYVDVAKYQRIVQGDIAELEALRAKYHQLDSNNQFLQKYIGELMATSNITGTRK